MDDLIGGIYRLLLSDIHEPVNIGNPKEMTILEFVDAITKQVNGTRNIVFKPLPVDDPKVRQPDISKAKELLGWEPEVSLEQGLKRTIEFFRSK